MRWSLIKSGFSKRTRASFRVEEWMNDSKLHHRESTIQQRRFWEHQIRDEEEYRAYMDYIDYNPVKHGYVKRALDSPLVVNCPMTSIGGESLLFGFDVLFSIKFIY